MKLSILPAQHVGLDCHDGLVISLLEWLKRENPFIFAEAWNFEFRPEIEGFPHTIGDRLIVNNVVSQDLLKEYCGVEINEVNNTNVHLESFMPVLKRELAQQRPLLIVQDLFWCSWSKEYYQQIHAPIHATLVIGYDETGIICMDYALKNPEAHLPYEYFNDSVNTVVTFDITKTPPNSSMTFHDIMKKIISSTKSYDSFNSIREFGRYVKESFDPVKELERFGVGNFNANPLNWQIERISTSRKLFALTLRELSTKFGFTSLNILADKLELSMPKWFTIMSMIIKSCIASDSKSLNKISNKILELADYEESIFEYFVSISENTDNGNDVKGVLNALTQNQGEKAFDVQYVELSGIYNNRAFDSFKGCSYIPDFTGEAGLILKDNNICKRILQMNGTSFELADVTKDVQDNILCEGQTIELPGKSYHKIGFVGCAVNGNYSGQLKVDYTDGSCDMINFQMSDCYPGGAGYEQDILWIGQCAKDPVNYTDRFTCQLYGQLYDLDPSKCISNITLPDCPNIHIFAISLIS